jgi:hypothetical protein
VAADANIPRKPRLTKNQQFGIAIFAMVLLAAGLGSVLPHTSPPTEPAAPDDPAQHEKDVAAFMAKEAVPRFMKDPSSAQFGDVWGMTRGVACGYVNGKNSFGAMTGQERFIYVMGAVTFENGGSHRFAKEWNTICVDKLLTSAPTGAMGLRWGSAPAAQLKQFMPPTEEGLSIYVPKGAPAPLEGVPVTEADFRFDHRRLYAADLYIDGEANRDAVKAALEKRYGKALTSDDTAHAYGWKWPERRVAIDMSYDDQHGRTTVTFAQGEH